MLQSMMREFIGSVCDIIVPVWPDAVPQLRYTKPFELLCSVIMSAQTTDEQVNQVTPALFARFPDARAMASAPIEEVQTLIRHVGFFRTKARHLVETSRILAERFGGEPPSTMEEMLGLPGVGRKTANLVLSACHGLPGIVVDTHVLRVAERLGISPKRDPALVETIIAENLDPSRHTAFSHALNRHGKYTCTARKPACAAGLPCPLERICPRTGVS